LDHWQRAFDSALDDIRRRHRGHHYNSTAQDKVDLFHLACGCLGGGGAQGAQAGPGASSTKAKVRALGYFKQALELVVPGSEDTHDTMTGKERYAGDPRPPNRTLEGSGVEPPHDKFIYCCRGVLNHSLAVSSAHASRNGQSEAKRQGYLNQTNEYSLEAVGDYEMADHLERSSEGGLPGLEAALLPAVQIGLDADLQGGTSGGSGIGGIGGVGGGGDAGVGERGAMLYEGAVEKLSRVLKARQVRRWIDDKQAASEAKARAVAAAAAMEGKPMPLGGPRPPGVHQGIVRSVAQAVVDAELDMRACRFPEDVPVLYDLSLQSMFLFTARGDAFAAKGFRAVQRLTGEQVPAREHVLAAAYSTALTLKDQGTFRTFNDQLIQLARTKGDVAGLALSAALLKREITSVQASIAGAERDAADSMGVNNKLKEHIEVERVRSRLLDEEADGERAHDVLEASAARHLEEYEGSLAHLDSQAGRLRTHLEESAAKQAELSAEVFGLESELQAEEAALASLRCQVDDTAQVPAQAELLRKELVLLKSQVQQEAVIREKVFSESVKREGDLVQCNAVLARNAARWQATVSRREEVVLETERLTARREQVGPPC
jgi:hypothetical protein